MRLPVRPVCRSWPCCSCRRPAAAHRPICACGIRRTTTSGGEPNAQAAAAGTGQPDISRPRRCSASTRSCWSPGARTARGATACSAGRRPTGRHVRRPQPLRSRLADVGHATRISPPRSKGKGQMPAFQLPDPTIKGLVHLVRMMNAAAAPPPVAGAAGAGDTAAQRGPRRPARRRTRAAQRRPTEAAMTTVTSRTAAPATTRGAARAYDWRRHVPRLLLLVGLAVAVLVARAHPSPRPELAFRLASDSAGPAHRRHVDARRRGRTDRRHDAALSRRSARHVRHPLQVPDGEYVLAIDSNAAPETSPGSRASIAGGHARRSTMSAGSIWTAARPSFRFCRRTEHESPVRRSPRARRDRKPRPRKSSC